MNETLTLDCGCELDLVDGVPQIDFQKIKFDCPKIWDLAKSGYTASVFQLGSFLGQKYTKELGPKDIEELALVINAIRPGLTKSYDEDGNVIAQVLCDRKNGIREVPDDALSKLIPETYGVLCIHENSWVSMADGTEKQIKNVVLNDEIVSVNQKTELCEFDRVLDIKKSPKKYGVKLKLSNGYHVILTPDHKVLTRNGMKKVEDLDLNVDVIAIPINQPKTETNSIIESKLYDNVSENKTNLSYLIGQLIGDGCSGFSIASGTKKNHDKLFPWIKKNFPKLNVKEKFSIRSYYIQLIGKKLLKDPNYGRRKTVYRKFIEDLTLDKTKNDKLIHDDIFKLNTKNRRSFLAGLFDADGHSSSAGCDYTTTNLQVLNGIRKLLSIEGIATYLNNDRRLHIIDTIKFKKIISPYLIIKKIITINYNGEYGWINKKELYKKYQESKLPYRKYLKNKNISESVLYSKGKFIKTTTAQKAGICFNDLRFMKIKSIEKIEDKQNFYSISVVKNRNLITNGIVISNCWQESVMFISQKLAGFSAVDSLKFMKGIAKKKLEILMKFEKQFVEGCENVGIVDKKTAQEIFDNLKASSRYSMNKCVSGSERLKIFGLRSDQFHPTIEEMYKIKNDREYAVETNHYQLWKKYNNQGYPHSYSIIDGRIKKNKIVDIIYQNKRLVFEIVTESGKKCIVTSNHKFPTPNGDKKLEDLNIGDLLYICGKYEKTNINYSFSDLTTEDIKVIASKKAKKINGCNGINNYGYTNGEYTKFKNNKAKLEDKCNHCGITDIRLETHHIDRNRRNNDLSNLEKLCSSCHKKADYGAGMRKNGEKGYPILTEKIVSITKKEEEDVYDITMEAPNHTFTFNSNIVSCNSHAVSYGFLSIHTLFVKSHFPYHYLCGWLRHAKATPKPKEEIRRLAGEARRLKIPLRPPNIGNYPNIDFFIENDSVYFGLASIKNCGEKSFKKMENLDVSLKDMDWTEFLICYSEYLTKAQIKNMIKTGCFDHMGKPRMYCEFEYDQLYQLTKTEKRKLKEAYETEVYCSLLDALRELTPTKRRQEVIDAICATLEHPPISLKDSKSNIIDNEKELLGINVSCSSIAQAKVPAHAHTCQQVSDCLENEYTVVGEIEQYRDFHVKKKDSKIYGERMGSFKLVDSEGECDVVIFPDQLTKYEAAMFNGNIILINGAQSRRGNGLIVNEVFEV